MNQFYELLQEIIDHGNESDDRTGTGTLSLFGKHLEFDLSNGFPLLPGKFTPFRLIAAELLWFLSGSTNNEDLRALNGNDKATIWEEWIGGNNNLGPIYGKQWRNWGGNIYNRLSGVDQIQNLINGLRKRPCSRRHIVSAWNVADLPDETISPQENVHNGQMALAPCHAFVQFGTRKLSLQERRDNAIIDIHPNECHEEVYHRILDDHNVPKYELSCHLYQRSCDVFLGLPFNIASYALLTEMIANVVGMIPGKLHMSFGDTHLYLNHTEQARELLNRELDAYLLPKLVITEPHMAIDDFTMESFKIVGYKSHSAISAPVAI
jgi:thymidylate synthase